MTVGRRPVHDSQAANEAESLLGAPLDWFGWLMGNEMPSFFESPTLLPTRAAALHVARTAYRELPEEQRARERPKLFTFRASPARPSASLIGILGRIRSNLLVHFPDAIPETWIAGIPLAELEAFQSSLDDQLAAFLSRHRCYPYLSSVHDVEEHEGA